jgi:hypothetical protein
MPHDDNARLTHMQLGRDGRTECLATFRGDYLLLMRLENTLLKVMIGSSRVRKKLSVTIGQELDAVVKQVAKERGMP